MTLSLTGVSHAFGPTAVLDDVSLEVRPGELVALVGPNGAGKTTLLHVMAGDLSPQRGEVRLDGTPIGRHKVAELARRRSVLPQEQRLAFGFRAVDVVRMGRAPWAGRPEEDLDDEVVLEALVRTDVLHLADRTYPTLSGGERSRTSLARVIAQSTRVVLLDEPTAALDISHAEQVLTEARRLAATGHAVVAVLHDLSVAAAHADRVCVLAEGRVRAVGPPREVMRPGLLSEVYRHPVDVIEHGHRLVVVPHQLPLPPTDEYRPQESPCVPAS